MSIRINQGVLPIGRPLQNNTQNNNKKVAFKQAAITANVFANKASKINPSSPLEISSFMAVTVNPLLRQGQKGIKILKDAVQILETKHPKSWATKFSKDLFKEVT